MLYLNNSAVTKTVWSPVTTIVFPLPCHRLASALHDAFTHTTIDGKYPVSWQSWQQFSATADSKQLHLHRHLL